MRCSQGVTDTRKLSIAVAYFVFEGTYVYMFSPDVGARPSTLKEHKGRSEASAWYLTKLEGFSKR